jgi:hypothetical protein
MGFKQSAAEFRRWWGEEFGIWLSSQRLRPFCLLRHRDATMSVAPAGCLWPQAGVRPIRREHLLPVRQTLSRLFAALGKLKPLGGTLSLGEEIWQPSSS